MHRRSMGLAVTKHPGSPKSEPPVRVPEKSEQETFSKVLVSGAGPQGQHSSPSLCAESTF